MGIFLSHFCFDCRPYKATAKCLPTTVFSACRMEMQLRAYQFSIYKNLCMWPEISGCHRPKSTRITKGGKPEQSFPPPLLLLNRNIRPAGHRKLRAAVERGEAAHAALDVGAKRLCLPHAVLVPDVPRLQHELGVFAADVHRVELDAARLPDVFERAAFPVSRSAADGIRAASCRTFPKRCGGNSSCFRSRPSR